MNAKLRKQAKNNFKADFFKLMNNLVFGKTKESVRKCRNTKLVSTVKGETIWFPNQIIMQQSYSQKI